MENRQRLKNRIKKSNGFTLVELIVTFALLGIFLVAVSTAISSATRTYYAERQTLAAYTVADTVLSEIRDDVQTMQRGQYTKSLNDEGYVKLRDSSGSTVSLTSTLNSDNELIGDTLEFVRHNDDQVAFAEQIDSKGYDGKILKKGTLSALTAETVIPAGYLVDRYYFTYYKNGSAPPQSNYNSLFIDQIVEPCQAFADKLPKVRVVRDVEQKLGIDFYQGYTVSLKFAAKTSSVDTEKNESAEPYVKYIKATVTVLQNGTNKRYEKSDYFALQNNVGYREKSTVYSDGPSAEPVEPTQCTVTYNANGGTPETTTYTKDAGQEFDVPTVTFAGHSFAGWYTAATGGELKIPVGTTTYTPSSSITLYAHWTSNYTVILDPNYDGANTTTVVGDEQNQVSLPDTLTREHYTFNGWYTDKLCEQPVTLNNGKFTITEDGMILYAKWTETSYTVTLDYNYTDSTPGAINGTYNSKIDLPSTATRDHYTFGGWYTDTNCTNKVVLDESSQYTITGNTTIYAKWTSTYYSVTFDANGGVFPSQAATKVLQGNADNPIVLPTADDVTRSGYTFKEWYTAATDGTQVSSPYAPENDGVTLYAHWSDNSYGFNLKGAVNGNKYALYPTSDWADIDSTDLVAGKAIVEKNKLYILTASAASNSNVIQKTWNTRYNTVADSCKAHPEYYKVYSIEGKVIYTSKAELSGGVNTGSIYYDGTSYYIFLWSYTVTNPPDIEPSAWTKIT